MPPGTDNAITATTEQQSVNRTSVLGRSGREFANAAFTVVPSCVGIPLLCTRTKLDHSFLTKYRRDAFKNSGGARRGENHVK